MRAHVTPNTVTLFSLAKCRCSHLDPFELLFDRRRPRTTNTKVELRINFQCLEHLRGGISLGIARVQPATHLSGDRYVVHEPDVPREKPIVRRRPLQVSSREQWAATCVRILLQLGCATCT